MADRGGALFQTLELIKKCTNSQTVGGFSKDDGERNLVTSRCKPCNLQTAANLGLHSVTRGVLRSLPPHCGLLRKDPLKSESASQIPDLSQP